MDERTAFFRLGMWIGNKLRIALDAAIYAFVVSTLLRWLDVLVIVRL